MEKKAILFDSEDKHGVDYTHMEFILSTGLNFHKGMTPLVAIQLFWKGFYPYLKTLAAGYEKYYELYRVMVDDQEDVLSKHAEVVFKYKWTQEWLRDKKTLDGKSMSWQLECFINQKIAEAKANREKAIRQKTTASQIKAEKNLKKFQAQLKQIK